MRKKYIIVSVIAISLGIILAILPAKKIRTEVRPNQMLMELLDETRYMSVDKVAEYIVEQNRFGLLIDVRTPEEYAEWSLPGAFNIPFDSILSPNYEYILNQDIYTNILFSNGTTYSSQAWMLLKRKGYTNNYIMKGGLNNFITTFLTTQYPLESESNETFDLYQFRNGVRQYFTGSGEIPASNEQEPKNEIIIKKNKKKEDDVGGC